MDDSYFTQAMNSLFLRIFDKATLVDFSEIKEKIFDHVRKGTDKDEALFITLASVLEENVDDVRKALAEEEIHGTGDFITRVHSIAKSLEKDPTLYKSLVDMDDHASIRSELQASEKNLHEYLQAEYTRIRSKGTDSRSAIREAVEGAINAKVDHFKKEGYNHKEAFEMASNSVRNVARKIWGDMYAENPNLFAPNPPPDRDEYISLFRYYRGKGYKPRDASFAAISHISSKKGVMLENGPWSDVNNLSYLFGGGRSYKDNVSPLKYIILNANTGNPVRVMDRKPESGFTVNGKRWNVLGIDRDMVWALPEGMKFNGNPSVKKKQKSNPLTYSGRPFWGEEKERISERSNLMKSLRNAYPHLAGYTDDQIEALIRSYGMPFLPQQQSPFIPAQSYPVPAQYSYPYPKMSYRMYHFDTETPLGDVILYEAPSIGDIFMHGAEEYRIIKVIGNNIFVKPRHPFKFAVVGIVRNKEGNEEIFDIIPFHNRREAIAGSYRMKKRMWQSGYKLRGGNVRVRIVPWHRVVKYQS